MFSTLPLATVDAFVHVYDILVPVTLGTETCEGEYHVQLVFVEASERRLCTICTMYTKSSTKFELLPPTIIRIKLLSLSHRIILLSKLCFFECTADEATIEVQGAPVRLE